MSRNDVRSVRRARRGRARSDRGSATVWVAMALAAIGIVFGGLLTMSRAVEARHRAGAAADLAALAAADHWMEGGPVACALAKKVARAQDARVTRCAVHGQISDVTAMSGTGPLEARARSRAGPAGPVGPRA
ncbi:Rv3654c family TadE-like protein [Streptomyces sp. NPDC016845]|uniref:Rv3654c family TadE-like protein n=1 Tax=Streptomyces sp. NPDC016845 TaxID=3364972 RepID=UPI00378DD815